MQLRACAKVGWPLGRPPKVYELGSTGLLRKFASVLDVPLTLGWVLLCVGWRAAVGGRRGGARASGHGATGSLCCCLTLRPWRCHLAMLEHRTQYVWYRRLYVLISRFALVNTLHGVYL